MTIAPGIRACGVDNKQTQLVLVLPSPITPFCSGLPCLELYLFSNRLYRRHLSAMEWGTLLLHAEAGRRCRIYAQNW